MRGKKFENLPWADNASGKKRMHVKKGDKVVVISGAYRSNEPREVLSIHAEDGTVVVQGVNMRWKHQKRSKQSPQGQRTKSEHPIDVSKVLLFSEKAKKGVRTRTQVVEKDGKKLRVRVGTCGTKFDS
jgi:large subunit ribosomal protein L24